MIFAAGMPWRSVLTRVEHDAVVLLRQVLGDDAPHRRVAEPLADALVEALRPRSRSRAPRIARVVIDTGPPVGCRPHLAPRTKPRDVVGLVELERVQVLAPRPLRAAEVVVEQADDGAERVHHQPLADEAGGVGQAAGIWPSEAAAAAACRCRWRTGSSRRPDLTCSSPVARRRRSRRSTSPSAVVVERPHARAGDQLARPSAIASRPVRAVDASPWRRRRSAHMHVARCTHGLQRAVGPRGDRVAAPATSASRARCGPARPCGPSAPSGDGRQRRSLAGRERRCRRPGRRCRSRCSTRT